MADRVLQRRDTAANWAAANPILAEGELGIVTDTKGYKIGDGVTRWNNLAYPSNPTQIVDDPGSGDNVAISQLAATSSIFSASVNSLLKFNLSEFCVKGKFINEEGEIQSHSDYGFIPKIYCFGIQKIVFSTTIRRCVCFDKDMSVLSNITNTTTIDIPDNAYFIGINFYLDKETFISDILYKEYNNVETSHIRDFEIMPLSLYASNKYLTPSGSEVASDNQVYPRAIYELEVEPLGIYNIIMRSLGSLATDLIFYDEDYNMLLSTSAASNDVKSKIVVAPLKAKYVRISTVEDEVTVLKLSRTDLLKESLNEIVEDAKTHNDYFQSVIDNNDNIQGQFVIAGSEILTDSGFIRVADGTKGSNNDYICSPFLPVVPGSNIGTKYTPGSTSGYAFYSAPREDAFVWGTKELTNIKVPDNALYFRVSSLATKEFVIGYIPASLGNVANIVKDAVINYDIKYSNLTKGFVEIGANTTKFRVSTSDDVTFRCILIRCFEGQVFELNTVAGTGTAKAYQFFNEDGESVEVSTTQSFTGKITVPEGAYYLGVNVNTAAMSNPSGNFYLRSVLSYPSETTPKNSIPLWYGKDMFFIKDTPLDIYAKEVLLKNYPSYNSIYVNHAPVVSTGRNYDFSLPQINFINPEGKIYFEDGAVIDIYANKDGLYNDSWNMVKDITVHTTDLALKSKSVKVMCIGSSTTEIGLATYVKKYLETLGVTMTGCGSKNDYLGTKSEGWYGWSNEGLCGKFQNCSSYPQTGTDTNGQNPFMKLATETDKTNYPDYCFTYVEGSTGTRQSYTEAQDKEQDFYIFDFAWYLTTRQVETPDVVFFLLGVNGSIENYDIYMPWIIDRIIQACPNAYIGINVCQAIRLESDADDEVEEMQEKFKMLYDYVSGKANPKLKVVSLHAHQSPEFSHNFEFSDGDNEYTSKATVKGGYLHMMNNGYLQDAKCIGAYIAYCLPDNE